MFVQVEARARFGLRTDLRLVSAEDVARVVHGLAAAHLSCYDGSTTPFLLHVVALLWCVGVHIPEHDQFCVCVCVCQWGGGGGGEETMCHAPRH
jgi:hypothetical protein